MLRASFKSSIAIASTVTRSRASVRFARPLVVLGTRFNSSQTPEERNVHIKGREELLKDWVAPIITYENVKKKTQQPSEVRAAFTFRPIDSQIST